ncbi:MAG: GTP-binding protein [Candidatus Hodarchaeales archaeon]|jgi:elongation factor 1-alpha
MVEKKPTISLIWIGHVDHGKSTTLGHLLSEIGAIDSRVLEKLNEEAIQHQMESWKWAYILDSLPEERKRGITADIAFYPFNTEKRNFMLIDAPGHRDFVKNMIRGASQADACVLMVSVVPNDIQSGLKIGGLQDPGGQTREHAVLASVLGIGQIIVAINKMDLVNYQKDRFLEAVTQIKKMFHDIQSPWTKNIDEIHFIPISGFKGDNLTKPSVNLKWYSGPSLIEALNTLRGPTFKDNLPMRFIGYDLDERHGFGTFLVGKTLGSSLRMGDTVRLLPLDLMSEIKEIWVQDAKTSCIEPGNHGSVLLKNISKDSLEEGVILAPVESKYYYASIIQTRLLILEGSFVPGSSFVLHCGTSYTTVQVSKITNITRVNPKYKNLTRNFEGNITIAFKAELIDVDLILDSAIVVEKFSEFPELGRVILRHSGQTIAVGIVKDMIKK